MKGRAFQSNFSMGILDEEFHGRVDLEVFVAAVSDCANGLPSTAGSIRRRPGFVDVGEATTPEHRGLLAAFRKSGGDQLVLELGHETLRFRTVDGAPVLSSGLPYAVTTPWAAEALDGLRWDQSNDVVFFTHKGRQTPPRALRRFGATEWDIVALENRNGPWRTENADAAKTLTVSALTGSVTVTATGHAPFTAAMVGERLRVRTPDGQPGCATWTPATDYKARELVQSDGKLYRAQASDRKSGTAAPLHDMGAVSDGNLVWTYLSDGAGELVITGYVSATQVTATVLRALPGWTVNGDGKAICADPAAIACGPTSRWAFGAWSARFGWPGDVTTTDEERLVFSGTSAEPGRYYATRTWGYGSDHVDFTPGLGSGRVTDDDALQRNIRGGADAIAWLKATTLILFGTPTRTGIIQGDDLEGGITPAANRARALAEEGAADVAPAVAHSGVLYVRRDRRGLNYLGVRVDQPTQEIDLALFVEDLLAEKLAGVVWANDPDRVAWCWTDAGSLLSVTFQPRQNQWGWSRHPLPGGFRVETATVVADAAEGRDVLFLAVAREKGETVQRRIWRQAARWRTGDAQTAIVYMDAAKVLAFEAPQTTLTGLGHLAGETVRVFGDGGARIFDAEVSEAGTVTTPEHVAVSHAVVGLRSAFLVEGLPLDVAGPGATQGMRQRVTDITISLADCVEMEVAFAGGPLEQEGGKPWGEHPAPTALAFRAPVGGRTERDARWRVFTDDCWPATLRAVRPTVTADD